MKFNWAIANSHRGGKGLLCLTLVISLFLGSCGPIKLPNIIPNINQSPDSPPNPPLPGGCTSAIPETSSFDSQNLEGNSAQDGRHVPLFEDLRAALQCQPIGWAENSNLWGQGGTANFRVMFAGSHYLQSIRFGNADQRTKARNRVIELLKTQEEVFGHMSLGPKANEQFVVDPHANFWITSMVAFTIGAWESNDEEIKTRMSRWWSTHFYYLKLSWTGSETRIPGTRLKSGTPNWSADTDIFHLATGVPPNRKRYIWIAPYYFKKMIETFPASIPNTFYPGKLSMPLHFEQTPRGYLAWMERPAVLPLTPVDWILSTGGGPGQFTFGMSWNTPPPH